jgi:hypothetical protein
LLEDDEGIFSGSAPPEELLSCFEICCFSKGAPKRSVKILFVLLSSGRFGGFLYSTFALLPALPPLTCMQPPFKHLRRKSSDGLSIVNSLTSLLNG